jgi:hypothetical protein
VLVTADTYVRALKLGLIGAVVGGLSAAIAVAFYGGDYFRDVGAAVITGFIPPP